MEKHSRVDLPEAWSNTTERGPAAVAILVRHCQVDHRIAEVTATCRSRLAGGLDDRNWDAFIAALRQYPRG